MITKVFRCAVCLAYLPVLGFGESGFNSVAVKFSQWLSSNSFIYLRYGNCLLIFDLYIIFIVLSCRLCCRFLLSLLNGDFKTCELCATLFFSFQAEYFTVFWLHICLLCFNDSALQKVRSPASILLSTFSWFYVILRSLSRTPSNRCCCKNAVACILMYRIYSRISR